MSAEDGPCQGAGRAEPPTPPHLCIQGARRAQDATVGDISLEAGLGMSASLLGASSRGAVYAVTTLQSVHTGLIPSASWSHELPVAGAGGGDESAC